MKLVTGLCELAALGFQDLFACLPLTEVWGRTQHRTRRSIAVIDTSHLREPAHIMPHPRQSFLRSRLAGRRRSNHTIMG